VKIDIKKNFADQPIRLLQITDSHLGEKPGEVLLGMDTDKSLELVLQQVQEERGVSDLLLATGDISSAGAASSFLRFEQMTKSLATHALWLPGNHDDWPTMQKTMAGNSLLERTAEVGNWQIVMLDSTIPGHPGGELSASELNFLKDTLHRSKAEHVLLCLHHHPVSISCQWLDPQQVTNSDAFFQIIDSYNSVRGVLWGHIHQQWDQQRNGVELMATPSTCIQFAAHSDDFKLAHLNPGYRWLELSADGNIKTGVSRLSSLPFTIDYDSSGY
jgi:Icc protein